MQSKLIEFLDSQITSIFDAIFSYEKEKRKPAISRLFLIVIFIVGIFLWGKFFDWVRTPLNFSDWSEINIPRIQFIQDSLRQGLLPLHMADKTSLHDISDRFFTLPDVITTPQMILLLFVSLKQFILIDVFINYTIGFFSLLWFRKKFNISILIFSAFFSFLILMATYYLITVLVILPGEHISCFRLFLR